MSNDPEHCGTCDKQACADSEFCQDGTCLCRPELTSCGGGCVDVHSDPDHCGACDVPCDQVCVAGSCESAAACGLTVCDGACVDTAAHPLHCGECGNACAVDQVCFGGECWDYEPTPGCLSCGGCECPDPESCCDLPGYGVHCVDTELACPG